MARCPVCGLENAHGAVTCGSCGSLLAKGTAPAVPAPAGKQGDATGGVIPYKNPKALLAYYLGIFSGLPLIGLPVGIAAFVLGIMGLRDRQRNPVIKGSLHAGIGIGCGCFFTALWTFFAVMIVVALVSES